MIPDNYNFIFNSPIDNADSIPYGSVCIIHFILKVNNCSRSRADRIRDIETPGPTVSIYLCGTKSVSVKSFEERESIFK